MTKSEKANAIELLKDQLGNSPFFYLADSSTLTVAEINSFRRKCFEKNIEVKVVKNTLVQKALEALDNDSYSPLYKLLKGPTTLLISEKANDPAKVIKEFRKKKKKPALKAAYIDTAVYIGDDQLETLESLKSKEDLIGDIVLLLQSPMKNVLGSLQSGSNKLTGLLKALEERAK